MKKSQLLKYAYDTYKVGQKYKHEINSEAFTIMNQDFDVTKEGNIRSEFAKGMLYYNGVWAEIITDEKPKEIVFDYPTITIRVDKDGFSATSKLDTRRFSFETEDLKKISEAHALLQ